MRNSMQECAQHALAADRFARCARFAAAEAPAVGRQCANYGSLLRFTVFDIQNAKKNN